MADFDKLAPLYAQVKQRLFERISNGVLAEGDFLPTEPELCAEFSVSRITLRRAVKELCDEGILVRQQGRGTVVAKRKLRQALVSISGFSEAFETDGHQVVHAVLAVDEKVRDTQAMGVFHEDDHQSLVCVDRLISVDGQPFTLEKLFFSINALPDVIDKVRAGASFFHTLRDANGPFPAAAERIINVGFANGEERKFLGVGSSQPVYRVEKTVFDATNRVISFSRLITPTHLITYSLRS